MLDKVGDLIREVAATQVLPRFQRLHDEDVQQKAPGDLVTVADQEAERALTRGLMTLLPGSVVVGEEAVAADPAVLDRVAGTGAVWIVDPVDGTNNFAAGKTPFALMVALLQGGVPSASWIYDPVADRMAMAESGSGASVDGVQIKTRTDAPPAAALQGVVSQKYLTPDLRTSAAENSHHFASVSAGRHCAAHEYTSVATDDQQFALFWRILPWDHVPGALIIREAGGAVLHLDGTEYHPTDSDRGLLAAANLDIWHTTRSTLFPNQSF